jgi:hypothetical protein
MTQSLMQVRVNFNFYELLLTIALHQINAQHSCLGRAFFLKTDKIEEMQSFQRQRITLNDLKQKILDSEWPEVCSAF